jgi:predicted ArsR family transcriptional regulator
MNEADFREMMSKRLAHYLRRRQEVGHEAAFEELLAGYPGLQQKLMGPRIAGRSLSEGFSSGKAAFARLGLIDDFIDISTTQSDAVIETLLTCMCENAMHDCGVSEACSVLCALDQEAARRAFPDLQIQQLRKKVEGAPLCVFYWARKRLPTEDVS